MKGKDVGTVSIRTVENGYELVTGMFPHSTGVIPNSWVFPNLETLFEWLRVNLRTPPELNQKYNILSVDDDKKFT